MVVSLRLMDMGLMDMVFPVFLFDADPQGPAEQVVFYS
jgi:hypothetical protein